MGYDECQHGHLRRKCETCELRAENERLRAENEQMRQFMNLRTLDGEFTELDRYYEYVERN